MNAIKRGDLAIIRTVDQGAGGITCSRYTVAVVTSITRDREAKAVRPVTGDDRLISVRDVPSHEIITIPAARLRVADALAAIQAHRSTPGTGRPPAYTSPVDLLRDLTPWHRDDPDCLAHLRRAAFTYVSDNRDQRCARCGVTTYGNGVVERDEDLCPVVRCAAQCPVGVDFHTDYPVGLTVRIATGFAHGATGAIDSVSDAYPPAYPGARTSHYAGRCYGLTLPFWGNRSFPEAIVCPVDDSAVERYAVRRESPIAFG